MKRKFLILTFLLASTLALGNVAYTVPAHTFHTSLMRVEFNEKEQLVEISLQVFTHDLENVLSRRSGKDVRLDKTTDVPQLTLAYVNETINLKCHDGRVKTLSWVGMEPQADAVWLYVETKMDEGLTGVELRDRIFFDLLDDQVNLVHIRYDDKKCDLVFKSGDDFKAITLAPRDVK